MANYSDDSARKLPHGGLADRTAPYGERNGDRIVVYARRQGAKAEIKAKAETLADTWIDELQWLAGFPGTWGEPRRGWF